jgi:hypothetical protein
MVEEGEATMTTPKADKTKVEVKLVHKGKGKALDEEKKKTKKRRQEKESNDSSPDEDFKAARPQDFVQVPAPKHLGEGKGKGKWKAAPTVIPVPGESSKVPEQPKEDEWIQEPETRDDELGIGQNDTSWANPAVLEFLQREQRKKNGVVALSSGGTTGREPTERISLCRKYLMHLGYEKDTIKSVLNMPEGKLTPKGWLADTKNPSWIWTLVSLSDKDAAKLLAPSRVVHKPANKNARASVLTFRRPKVGFAPTNKKTTKN